MGVELQDHCALVYTYGVLMCSPARWEHANINHWPSSGLICSAAGINWPAVVPQYETWRMSTSYRTAIVHDFEACLEPTVDRMLHNRHILIASRFNTHKQGGVKWLPISSSVFIFYYAHWGEAWQCHASHLSSSLTSGVGCMYRRDLNLNLAWLVLKECQGPVSVIWISSLLKAPKRQ